MTDKFEAEQNKEQKTITPRNDHPESVQNQTEAKEEKMKQLIKSADSELQDIINNRATWERRQTRWHKARYGIRKPKSFPFPGSSNINIPTIDKAIRKLKPNYSNLIWQPEKIAEFVVLPNVVEREGLEQTALYNEQMLNHLIKDKMKDTFKRSLWTIDRMLQAGKSVVKVVYNFQTEEKIFKIDLEKDLTPKQEQIILNNPELRQEGASDRALSELLIIIFAEKGFEFDLRVEEDKKELKRLMKAFRNGKTKLRVKTEKVIQNAPEWVVIKPQDFLINGRYNDIQEAPLVSHRMFFTPNNLKKLAKSGRFGKKGAKVVDRIISKAREKNLQGNDASSSDANGNEAEYQNSVRKLTGNDWYQNEETLIEIREVGLYAMPDEDGILRRCMLTYAPVHMEEELKFVILPYDHQKWPYVAFEPEENDDGWFSARGIPAQVDYLATLINIKHNQRVDVQVIESAPMMQYVQGQVNPANIRYRPGQGIPVKQMGSVQPLQIKVGAGQELFQEEQLLNQYIESYLSTPDFGQTSLGSSSKPRTASEVIDISAQKDVVFSLDATMFLNSLRELLEMTWMLWLQYGDETYELTVKGFPNPVRAEPQSELTQSDVNKVEWKRNDLDSMKIRPKGVLQDVNPILRAQRANQLLLLTQNPIVGQWLKTEWLAKYIVRTIVPEQVDAALKSPEEVQAEQEQALGQQEDTENKQVQLNAAFKEQDHQNKMTEDTNKINAQTRGKLLEQAVEAQAEKDPNVNL